MHNDNTPLRLRSLFARCLNADYLHTPESGNYAVELEGDTVYLLFECSNGIEDWQNNLDFPAEPYLHMTPKWQCHRGFLRVWKAMRDEVEAKISGILNACPEIKSIVCVGYSHGGALAVLATEDMEFHHGHTHTVEGYGFGAPRVLWGRVPATVRNRLRRFVTVRNIPDIVTHLPPRIFGFSGAGKLLRIGASGRYSPVGAHYPQAYLRELTPDVGSCPLAQMI